jgi:hypothetical protein
VTKSILVAQFLRAQAWWRLDRPGASALQVGRSVVSLLDAAAYLRDVLDDDPDIVALDAAGCFRGDTFDPGQEGTLIVRQWQLADEPTGGPRDLLAALVLAAHLAGPLAVHLARPPAAETSIPRQPGAPRTPASGLSRFYSAFAAHPQPETSVSRRPSAMKPQFHDLGDPHEQAT